MNQLPAIVVEELDVPVLLRRDGDGQRGVAEDLVDLARSAYNAAQHQQQSEHDFLLEKKRKFCKVWPADVSSELLFDHVKPF